MESLGLKRFTGEAKLRDMKRKTVTQDEREAGEKVSTPVYSGEEAASFVKYSQNMDLPDTFNLSMLNGRIYNEESKKVLCITLSKNAKIGRQLDRILKFIKDHKDTESEGEDENKEIILVATGDSIQKMVTIVEILKQKISQMQDYDKSYKDIPRAGFQNTSIAKLPEYSKVVISGEVVGSDKIRLNYTQLNFIDYTLMEKQVCVNSKRQCKKRGKKRDVEDYMKDGLYDRDTLNQVLKIDKLVKVPVMYIYMNFHRHEELPVKYVSKFKNLVSNGWSIQQS